MYCTVYDDTYFHTIFSLKLGSPLFYFDYYLYLPFIKFFLYLNLLLIFFLFSSLIFFHFFIFFFSYVEAADDCASAVMSKYKPPVRILQNDMNDMKQDWFLSVSQSRNFFLYVSIFLCRIIYWFTYLFIYLFIFDQFIYWLIYIFVRWFIYSFIHLTNYLFISSLLT